MDIYIAIDKKDLKKIFFALRSIRENIIPKRKQVKKTKSLTFCKKSTTLLSIPNNPVNHGVR